MTTPDDDPTRPDSTWEAARDELAHDPQADVRAWEGVSFTGISG